MAEQNLDNMLKQGLEKVGQAALDAMPPQEEIVVGADGKPTLKMPSDGSNEGNVGVTEQNQNTTQTQQEPVVVQQQQSQQATNTESVAVRLAGKTVPVVEHIKLRERAQGAEGKVAQLEAEVEFLKSQITQTPAENGGHTNLSDILPPLDGNVTADDYPTIGQADARAAAIAERMVKKHLDAIRKQDAANRQTAEVRSRVEVSDAKMRTALADYDVVMNLAETVGALSQADGKQSLEYKEPAFYLYTTAKRRMLDAGVQIPVVQKKQVNQQQQAAQQQQQQQQKANVGTVITERTDALGVEGVPEGAAVSSDAMDYFRQLYGSSAKAAG